MKREECDVGSGGMAYDQGDEGEGMSISEIARQMRMGSNTVKKHLRLDKSLK